MFPDVFPLIVSPTESWYEPNTLIKPVLSNPMTSKSLSMSSDKSFSPTSKLDNASSIVNDGYFVLLTTVAYESVIVCAIPVWVVNPARLNVTWSALRPGVNLFSYFDTVKNLNP